VSREKKKEKQGFSFSCNSDEGKEEEGNMAQRKKNPAEKKKEGAILFVHGIVVEGGRGKRHGERDATHQERRGKKRNEVGPRPPTFP